MMKPGRKAAVLAIIIGREALKRVCRFFSRSERDDLTVEISRTVNVTGSEKELIAIELAEYIRLADKMPAKPLIGFDLILSMLLFAFLLVFVLFTGIYRGEAQGIVKNLELIISFGGGYFIFFPVIVLYIRAEHRKDILEFGYKSRAVVTDIFYGAAGGIFAALLLVIINMQSPVNPRASAVSGVTLDIYIFVLSALAPVCEEVVFRGLILRALAKKNGYTAAIAVSSALFAAAHLPGNLFEGALYFLIGIILGLLYKARQNLIPSTIAHSIANLSIFI